MLEIEKYLKDDETISKAAKEIANGLYEPKKLHFP